jgi:AraC-like DNA-binding protein
MPEEKSPSVALDRHLSIAKIAQQWGVSKDTVRRHFERVPESYVSVILKQKLNAATSP